MLADLARRAGDLTASRAHQLRAMALFADVGDPGTLSPEIWRLVDW